MISHYSSHAKSKNNPKKRCCVEPETIVTLIVLALGLSFGSFVTLASWRLPRDEDVVFTPSRCPSCGHALEGRDMIPVLSLLLQNMRCRWCSVKVSWRYPLIEAITAIIFMVLYAKYGATWQGLLLALLAVGLLTMIVVDFEHYLIPDEIHCALIPLGLLYVWVTEKSWWEHLTGLAVGLGTGLVLRYGYRVLRGKDGLGMGDVKFLAVCGVWLGVPALLPFLFFAGIFGVVTGLIWRALGNGHLFPFGPALALSMFLCVTVPEIVLIFYDPGLLML